MSGVPKYAAKRDENEAEIIEALRDIGASVETQSGKNIPDLIVGFRGANFRLEVKMPDGKLSDGQAEWHRNWRGQKAVVRTVDDALRAIGAIE